jgi:uncharacterized protein YjbI with pentapeptide repeats
MAIAEQVALLKSGARVWNEWRQIHRSSQIDLSGSNFNEADLEGVDLHDAILDRIRLRWAYLRRANLSNASVVKADLRIIDLSQGICGNTDFSHSSFQGAYMRQGACQRANFTNCNLKGVNFDQAKLQHSNLEGADASNAIFVDVDFEDARLNNCRVYGASVWNAKGLAAGQQDLIITRPGEPTVTVDNLEVAQFIYLLLNNQQIRKVIDTITSKAVLILGRFTPERKAVLDALRTDLRSRDYLPIIFDFDVPSNRDTDETVNLLARMARFIVADVTEAKSVLQELKGIVESLPSVPVQPILASFDQTHGMFDHLRRYPWVLDPIWYDAKELQPARLSAEILDRAEKALAQRGS